MVSAVTYSDDKRKNEQINQSNKINGSSSKDSGDGKWLLREYCTRTTVSAYTGISNGRRLSTINPKG